MLLDPLAQIGDRALGGHAEELGERVVGDGADGRGDRAQRRQLPQQPVVMLHENVVNQVLRDAGQDDVREAVDEQQRDAEKQASARAPDQVPRIAHEEAEALPIELLFLFLLVGHR